MTFPIADSIRTTDKYIVDHWIMKKIKFRPWKIYTLSLALALEIKKGIRIKEQVFSEVNKHDLDIAKLG